MWMWVKKAHYLSETSNALDAPVITDRWGFNLDRKKDVLFRFKLRVSLCFRTNKKILSVDRVTHKLSTNFDDIFGAVGYMCIFSLTNIWPANCWLDFVLIRNTIRMQEFFKRMFPSRVWAIKASSAELSEVCGLRMLVFCLLLLFFFRFLLSVGMFAREFKKIKKMAC